MYGDDGDCVVVGNLACLQNVLRSGFKPLQVRFIKAESDPGAVSAVAAASCLLL
jgi:hypothetical protein